MRRHNRHLVDSELLSVRGTGQSERPSTVGSPGKRVKGRCGSGTSANGLLGLERRASALGSSGGAIRAPVVNANQIENDVDEAVDKRELNSRGADEGLVLGNDEGAKSWRGAGRPRASHSASRRGDDEGSYVDVGEQLQPSTGKAKKSKPELVTIHVCDETRNVTRDFRCEKALLVQEMQYFQGYVLEATQPCDEVDILVHCDLKIFEWLFDYIHMRGPSGSPRSPDLEISSAVSILISSDFLMMGKLVGECLEFLARHLDEIIRLPIDLSCLKDSMVAELAALTTLEELAMVVDRKDKLLSRVHKKRIELDFRDRCPTNTIYCCGYCHHLFPEKGKDVMECHMAPISIGFRGNIIRRHSVLKPWSLTALVTSLHRQGMSWTEVYWFLWGLTQTMKCARCGEVFIAGDLNQCRYHKEAQPSFDDGGDFEGAYRCCNQKVYRFCIGVPPRGCAGRKHVIDESTVDASVLRLLKLKEDCITYEGWRKVVLDESKTVAASMAAAAAASSAQRRTEADDGDDSSGSNKKGKGASSKGGRGQPHSTISSNSTTSTSTASKLQRLASCRKGSRPKAAESNQGGAGAPTVRPSTLLPERTSKAVKPDLDDSGLAPKRSVWDSDSDAGVMVPHTKRGLLPGQHPLGTSPHHGGESDWDLVMDPNFTENQLRKWHMDKQREKDAVRVDLLVLELGGKRDAWKPPSLRQAAAGAAGGSSQNSSGASGAWTTRRQEKVAGQSTTTVVNAQRRFLNRKKN